MKAKELIKILQAADPEEIVRFRLSKDDEYRERCAKAEIVTGEVLGYLTAESVEICDFGEGLYTCVTLKQDNLKECSLDFYVDEFDKNYKER